MGRCKMVLGILAPLVVLAGSCGGSSSPLLKTDDAGDAGDRDGSSLGVGASSAVCVPGDSKDCAGPGACQGYQTCADDGSRYGACQCGGGSGGSDGSATGGVGGSSGWGGGGVGGSSGWEGGGTAGVAGACARASYSSEPLPLDMLITLDQSGSMGQGSPTVWAQVTGALAEFVQSPESVGIGVGIGYFPLSAQEVQCISNDNPPGCACFDLVITQMCYNNAGGSCLVADYATPDVAIQPLPGIAQAIVDSLAAHSPNGGTPTYPALQGAMQYAKSYATANPAHKTTVVLATDGMPNDCSSTIENVSQVAAAGLAEAPAIQTFVIGIGNVANLDTIAQAGGTGRALIVDTANAGQGFLDAMNTIRGSPSYSCSFQVPTPSDGAVVDPAQVQLTLTLPNGQPQVIPPVSGASQCDSVGGGWYYDDPSQPSRIDLCPATCDRITTPGVSLTIVAGCR